MKINIPPNENQVILNVDRESGKHITLRDVLPLITCNVRLVTQKAPNLVIEANNGKDLLIMLNDITILDVEKIMSLSPSLSAAFQREEIIGHTLYEQKLQICIFV